MKSDQEREATRAELANKLINENLAPFVETMVKATKLSAAILWENAAIYLFWVYETLIPTEGNAKQVSRAKEDFHYLLREFNCTSFTCGANPFMPYYSDKLEREEGAIRFRRTCCLYDQVSEGGACCKTCPKARGGQAPPGLARRMSKQRGAPSRVRLAVFWFSFCVASDKEIKPRDDNSAADPLHHM